MMKIVFRIILSLFCQMSLAACLQYKAAQAQSESAFATIPDGEGEPIGLQLPGPDEIAADNDLFPDDPLGLPPPSEIPAVADIYNSQQLEIWYKSRLPRGDQVTNGDIPRGIRRVRNRLPIGNSIVLCAGAGCPLKIPFTFTDERLVEVAQAMSQAMAESEDCQKDSAACERRALSAAMVAMEMIVYHDLLTDKSIAELEPYFIEAEDNDPFGRMSSDQQLDLDCVDQATNGISYLVVLANNGLLRHHQIIEPGLEYFGLQPHYFTRIVDDEGGTYKFDLYHRGRFGLRPYIMLL